MQHILVIDDDPAVTSLLKRLRAGDGRLPVLMLTARDASADQVQGLESGADDYVVKPFTFEVLLARIHSLLRRQRLDHPPVLRFADLTLDTGSHDVHRGQREVPLTSLEFRVLQEFLLHPRQVRSKDVLLERVWGYDFDANVVEVYIKQLRQKLEAEGEARLIQTIRNVGYVLREN